jgi:hypothetical protein
MIRRVGCMATTGLSIIMNVGHSRMSGLCSAVLSTWVAGHTITIGKGHI